MTERSLHKLLDGGGFFEGPRWHDDTWWVSDFYRHHVATVDAEGGVIVVDAVTPTSAPAATRYA